MPRIRTTKPEHWNDKELVNISLQAHLLWIGSWNFSDDKGIFENDPMMLRSQVFPRRKDIRLEMVSQWLDQLVKARFLIPFTHSGQGYYISRTFSAHQRIDKPQPSKIPADVIKRILQDHSENVPGSVPLYSSGEDSKVKGKDIGAPSAPNDPPKEEGGRKNTKFTPPTLNQVADYFLKAIGDTTQPNHWPEDKCRNNAEQFLDHYTANGWVQGRGKPIKDWQAACRNWIRHGIQRVFDKPEPAEREKPFTRRHDDMDQRPQLKPIQEELNALYDLWRDNPDHCTVISVTAEHYNFLKSARMISFSDTEAAGIRTRALAYMKEKTLVGDQALTRLMKAFGVLQFFEQLKSQARETVFDDPQ